MKKLLLKSLSLFLAVLMIVPAMATGAYAITAESPSSYRFSDVSKSDWFYDHVAYTNANGIFKGVSDTEFDPHGVLTRAMFVTLLGRIAEADTSDYKNTSFSDVEFGTWYGPYVAWAEENRITMGTESGLFEPDAPVTREQIATFLHRFLRVFSVGAMGVYDLKYEDASEISDYAVSAVKGCYELGLMKGDTDNRFRPADTATRAEVAQLVMNYLEK